MGPEPGFQLATGQPLVARGTPHRRLPHRHDLELLAPAQRSLVDVGFLESLNLVGGIGLERADEVLPGALDWLDRNGAPTHGSFTSTSGILIPRTAPPSTTATRSRTSLPGVARPGGARAEQGPSRTALGAGYLGILAEEWKPLPARAPGTLVSDADVKRMFDGYDVGVRFVDDAVGALCSKLADLDVLNETATLVTSDHGESFGELGVYADHQAADEPTAHVPAILSWPGLAAGVQPGLHYQLDVAATVADLAGAVLPEHWDGVSLRAPLERGEAAPGRDFLVLSQGAWTCQRGVRFGDRLYLSTRHDGFHVAWPDEMLFDIGADPHQQCDLAQSEPSTLDAARRTLSDWRSRQLSRSLAPEDPFDTILAEGGPYHVRGHLRSYVERLRATGRGHWADVLVARHGSR